MALALERCREELASRLLDAQESVSCRELSLLSQCDLNQTNQVVDRFCNDNKAQIGRVQLVIHQQQQDESSDPRARTISLRVSTKKTASDHENSKSNVLSEQLYGVFYHENAPDNEDEQATMHKLSLSFWNQEQRVRNEIFDASSKNSNGEVLQVLWQSSVESQEAELRNAQANHGAKTASAFDGFASSSSTSKLSSSSSSTSLNGKKRFGTTSSSSAFFRSTTTTTASNAATKPKPKAQPETSPRYLSRSQARKAQDEQEKEAKGSHAIDMSKVLSVDSSDEDSDGPVFVKKMTTTKSNAKQDSTRKRNRVVSDDEDDEEEEEEEEEEEDDKEEQVEQKKTKQPTAMGSPRAKTSKAVRNVKRKLSTSPAVHVPPPPSKKNKTFDHDAVDEEEEQDEVQEVTVPTTKSVVVTKTRINEQGYMVTEKTVETVQLTPQEIANARQQAEAKRRLQRQHQQRQAALVTHKEEDDDEEEDHQEEEQEEEQANVPKAKAKPKTKAPVAKPKAKKLGSTMPQQRKINDFFTRK